MSIERTPSDSAIVSESGVDKHKPLSEIIFALPRPSVKVASEPASETQLLYNQCYWTVFGRLSTPEDLIKTGSLKTLAKVLDPMPKEKRRQFILASMWGHREAKITARFKAHLLTGSAAENRFKLYGKAVQKEWGHLDTSNMDRFFNSELSATVLEDSELLAARWIIGHKIGKGGDSIEAMFLANESKLNPLWLALEPAYLKKLGSQVTLPTTDPDSQTSWQVRTQVSQWNVVFQKRTTQQQLEAWISLRNEAARSTLTKVMTIFGQDIDNYYADHLKWTSSLDLWDKLGMAFRQVAVGAIYAETYSPLTRWLKPQVGNLSPLEPV